MSTSPKSLEFWETRSSDQAKTPAIRRLLLSRDVSYGFARRGQAKSSQKGRFVFHYSVESDPAFPEAVVLSNLYVRLYHETASDHTTGFPPLSDTFWVLRLGRGSELAARRHDRGAVP